MMEPELITGEFIVYQRVCKEMKHTVINYQVQFVNGDTRTKTIEGFRSLLKRAWFDYIITMKQVIQRFM